MKRILLSTALVLGIAGTVGASWAVLSVSDEAGQPSGISVSLDGSDRRNEAVAEYELRNDPRVRAFVQAYEALVDSVAYGKEDVVFFLGSRPIHFQDGRMLEEGSLDRREDCDPIFYRYPLGTLTEIPSLREENPTYCTDLQESLWGTTDAQIREHGGSTRFLDHRLFVNNLVIDALAAVETDLLEVAKGDRSVASWIDDLDITYSFVDREIAGSPTRSNHAWGMAVDLVPDSYDGQDVYWQWSRVYNKDEWRQIPLERRWSPPGAVIEIFERHGFVWGGKWAHFDNIHFEYRPEILLYNQLISS